MRAELRSERGFDRVVNFSDAVVAIAITLLVLPLADLVSHGGEESVWDLIGTHWYEFAGFLLTFVVTALFWMTHHRIFEMIKGYDGRLLWLNMLWLLFIVLLPFSSGAVSGLNGFTDGGGVVYAGTMACLSLSQGFICVHVMRQPQLLADGVGTHELRPERSWAFAAFFVVIAVISLWFPEQASWLMLLLIPLGRLLQR